WVALLSFDRLGGRPAVLARRGLLAQSRWRRHVPTSAGRVVAWDWAALHPATWRDVRFGPLAAAELLPVDRGRPERDTTGQPCLHPCLSQRRPRWLVRRAGHRRGDRRTARRRLPHPAAQSERRRAVPDRPAGL